MLEICSRLSLADLDPPDVVLANTYYWYPGSSSSHRCRNEERWQEEVYLWLLQILMNLI